MPPRVRLPRLTLYTGGKECGLCEVAKVDLAQVRTTHPFNIKIWNIRDPPKDATEDQVHHWRRLYQYEIPVLHLEGERIQKNRIDADALRAALDKWHAENVEAAEQECAKP